MIDIDRSRKLWDTNTVMTFFRASGRLLPLGIFFWTGVFTGRARVGVRSKLLVQEVKRIIRAESAD